MADLARQEEQEAKESWSLCLLKKMDDAYLTTAESQVKKKRYKRRRVRGSSRQTSSLASLRCRYVFGADVCVRKERRMERASCEKKKRRSRRDLHGRRGSATLGFVEDFSRYPGTKY